MQESQRLAILFADAWGLYDDAIEILESGKPRIAAEVAWGAAKRATDALLLVLTGREPGGTGQTTRWLRRLGLANAEYAAFYQLYNDRIIDLHGRCFYSGNCPTEVINTIRGTSSYIQEAMRLAGVGENAEN